MGIRRSAIHLDIRESFLRGLNGGRKQGGWPAAVKVVAAAHRRANICVTKQEKVPLVTLTDPSGRPHHLSTFLQQPAGTQSMLNTKALQRYEYVGDDVYRCYLPKVTLLNFEVAPVVDLFVAASDVDCRVEMRQCMVISLPWHSNTSIACIYHHGCFWHSSRRCRLRCWFFILRMVLGLSPYNRCCYYRRIVEPRLKITKCSENQRQFSSSIGFVSIYVWSCNWLVSRLKL